MLLPDRRDWAREQLLDRGTHPDDVEAVLDLWAIQRERHRLLWARAVDRRLFFDQIKITLQIYSIGGITQREALDRLSATGLAPRVVELLVRQAELRVEVGRLQESIRAIRRAFFEGRLSGVAPGLGPSPLRQALLDLGVTPDRASRYEATWKVAMGDGRKRLTTERILGLHRRGLLTAEQALERLLNLGWARADALLWLGEAQIQIAEGRSRAVQAAERQSRSAAREAESALRRLQAETRRLQAELRRITPISTLQRWFVRGRIGEEYFLRRLRAQGYPPDESEQYLQDARDALAKSAPRGSQNGQSTPAGTPPQRPPGGPGG